MENNELDNRLQMDALQVAEDMTGISYKEDECTSFLGMALMLSNNKRKDDILLEQLDSTFSNNLDYYEKVLAAEGFSKIFEMEVPQDPTRKEKYQDKYFIYWHPDGLLLSFDTFYDNSVNGGKIYFNYLPNNLEQYYELHIPASRRGGKEKWFSGSIDCRVAIRYYLGKMRENGKFLSLWKERPFLWLLHYMDTKTEEYDYKAINEERIAQLPEYVRKAISPA